MSYKLASRSFMLSVLFAIVCIATVMVSLRPAKTAAPVAAAVTTNQLSQLLLSGSYTMTNGYKPWGGSSGHAGIDFGGTGDGVTSVYAPVSGTITANTSACGKVAIYDGSNTIILAHMASRTALPVGSPINAKTYVGKASKVVGGGCMATSAHLHTEIRTGSNTYMANPTSNNTATTLDPLGYNYPPVISISSPTSMKRGSSYTISWSASSPSSSAPQDVSVHLVSGSAKRCQGQTGSTIRASGGGYVTFTTWTVPSAQATGKYFIKVAVRDSSNAWGCSMNPVSIL